MLKEQLLLAISLRNIGNVRNMGLRKDYIVSTATCIICRLEGLTLIPEEEETLKTLFDISIL